jgi:competence protein ComEA
MFKKLFAFFAAMSLVAAFAAVDVNKGTEAQLDSIKGIGPATSALIMTERKKAEFKNWDDLISRVKGLGDKTAAKLSVGGLTVGGTSYKPSPAAPTAGAKPAVNSATAEKK